MATTTTPIPPFLKYILLPLLPLLSAAMWLSMLLAMFLIWSVHQHSAHLPSMTPNQRIAYISNIAAEPGVKPLFIAGAVVTTVFLDLSFAAERWLRHRGRLARNRDRMEKVLSGLAILFALAGTAGLILLSIFDVQHHPHLHDGFLLLFVASYVLSAIAICAEYQRLGIHFRTLPILRISFWLKLAFILIDVVLAVVFAGFNFSSAPNKKDVAAVVEWVIALIFEFWVLSFALDLAPAVRGWQSGLSQGQRAQREGEEAETELGIAIGVGMEEVGQEGRRAEGRRKERKPAMNENGYADGGVGGRVNGDVNGVMVGNGHATAPINLERGAERHTER